MLFGWTVIWWITTAFVASTSNMFPCRLLPPARVVVSAEVEPVQVASAQVPWVQVPHRPGPAAQSVQLIPSGFAFVAQVPAPSQASGRSHWLSLALPHGSPARAKFGVQAPWRQVSGRSQALALPSPQGPVLKRVLGSWMVAGVTTLQSGAPLSITALTPNSAYGLTTDRVQLVDGCELKNPGSPRDNLDNYFNKACIAPFPVIGNDLVVADTNHHRLLRVPNKGTATPEPITLRGVPQK